MPLFTPTAPSHLALISIYLCTRGVETSYGLQWICLTLEAFFVIIEIGHDVIHGQCRLRDYYGISYLASPCAKAAPSFVVHGLVCGCRAPRSRRLLSLLALS